MLVNGLLILLISYIIGSFPTAILAGKLQKNIDIRQHGSGNAGATNVLRVLGWKTALIVLLIDMFKGFVPVFWIPGLFYGPGETYFYMQVVAAAAAVAGHIWTVFAGFKGGKGVGTSAGVFLGLAPVPLLFALGVFVIVVAISRYVSLGSILSALVFLLVIIVQKYIFVMDIPDLLFYLAILIVVLIWFLHRANIRRLLSGTENKIGSGKKTTD